MCRPTCSCSNKNPSWPSLEWMSSNVPLGNAAASSRCSGRGYSTSLSTPNTRAGISTRPNTSSTAAAAAPRHVVRVHLLRQFHVRDGIKAGQEFLALVHEVIGHLPGGGIAKGGRVRRLHVASKFGRVPRGRPVADHAELAGHLQAGGGLEGIVGLPGRIRVNGLPLHLADGNLPGRVLRVAGDGQDGTDKGAVRVAGVRHTIVTRAATTLHGKFHRLHAAKTAAHDGLNGIYLQMIAQQLQLQADRILDATRRESSCRTLGRYVGSTLTGLVLP